MWRVTAPPESSSIREEKVILTEGIKVKKVTVNRNGPVLTEHHDQVVLIEYQYSVDNYAR